MPVLVKRTGFVKYRATGKSKPIRAIRDHIKYIEMQKEKHRNEVKLFSRDQDEVSRQDFMERVRAQKENGVVAHKIVISLSEDERNRLGVDMKELVRETMAQYEEKHKRQLDWVAAIHDDAGHPHAHVVIRGRDEAGKSVYIATGHMRQMERIAERVKKRMMERNLERNINRELDIEKGFLLDMEKERELHPSWEKERERERELELER